jgi:serine/threonine protein kinase
MMLLKQKQIFVLLWNCKNKISFIHQNLCFSFRISGGELFERVIDDDFILTERLCELYTMQICEGVHFMHSCNIIHLDMKVGFVLF